VQSVKHENDYFEPHIVSQYAFKTYSELEGSNLTSIVTRRTQHLIIVFIASFSNHCHNCRNAIPIAFCNILFILKVLSITIRFGAEMAQGKGQRAKSLPRLNYCTVIIDLVTMSF
jgi:hypothetical protein